MKKETQTISNIFKERKFVLFLSVLALIFPMFVFASTSGNILEKFAIAIGIAILISGIAIFIIVLFLFVLINKNYIRKIKNNKKLFLFGIIPFLITAVLILLVSVVSFLRVFKMSLYTLSFPIMDFFNWTLGTLLIYSVLIVLVGVYFIFKKNKNIGYGFFKLGVSTFGVCWVIYGVFRILVTGPADYM